MRKEGTDRRRAVSEEKTETVEVKLCRKKFGGERRALFKVRFDSGDTTTVDTEQSHIIQA